jgi:site-specific DNA-methyltransferase (adenine-specific)
MLPGLSYPSRDPVVSEARAPSGVGQQSEASRREVESRSGVGVSADDGAAGASLWRADAVAWLESLPAASVDLVITDPPYESLEKHRAVGTTTRLKHSKSSSNDWFAIFPNHRFPKLFAELYRVLKKDRHLYLFCDQETMFVAKPAAEAAGFRFWKPLVWDKKKIGMGYHYRSRYELILFFEKGKRKLADLSVPDVLEHPRIRGGYPSQKPTEITDVLVRQSSEAGMLVVDPFMGSGTTGVSAVAAGRRFAGCDVCEEAIAVTRARIASEAARPRLGGDMTAPPEGPRRGSRTKRGTGRDDA